MPAQKQFNEGKACDAVIRLIEAREGAARKNMRFPEQENHAAPVELVCDIGNLTFAFEHTGIEPFTGHVRLQVEAPIQLKPIKDALADALPTTEDFELQIPSRALEDLKGQKLGKARQSIIEWIKKVAVTLPIADIGRYVTPIKNVSLPNVPFEVSLHRRTTGGYRAGVFSVVHRVNGVLEDYRLTRIREAYNRKGPKLAAWRRDECARSVLILEENDLQLTNSQLVADTIARIEQESKERPDEIYLVDTSIGDPWLIWAIRIGSEGYYSLCASQKSMTEVNPNCLLDVTHH